MPDKQSRKASTSTASTGSTRATIRPPQKTSPAPAFPWALCRIALMDRLPRPIEPLSIRQLMSYLRWLFSRTSQRRINRLMKGAECVRSCTISRRVQKLVLPLPSLEALDSLITSGPWPAFPGSRKILRFNKASEAMSSVMTSPILMSRCSPTVLSPRPSTTSWQQA